MKFVIKVEGVEHQSQLIILNSKKMTLVDSIDDFIKKSDLVTRYDGREVFAEYIGKSRIDGEPMFKIDTLSIDREDKISQILN
jgi:hypothetical protein